MKGFNKVRGNMYPDMDYTTNPIRGLCPFRCGYCYIANGPAAQNDHYQQNPHVVVELIVGPMPEGKRIFVGSSIDMWAPEIPSTWIMDVLEWCNGSVVDDLSKCNEFLFQSKYPERFLEFLDYIPAGSTLGTTVETNRYDDYYLSLSKAPPFTERVAAMRQVRFRARTMISMEPLLPFDLEETEDLMSIAQPGYVSVGADTSGTILQQPSQKDVCELVSVLALYYATVKLKPNLKNLPGPLSWAEFVKRLRHCGGEWPQDSEDDQ